MSITCPDTPTATALFFLPIGNLGLNSVVDSIENVDLGRRCLLSLADDRLTIPEEHSRNLPATSELGAMLHEIDLARDDWPDEDTVPPNDDVIRSTEFVLEVCNELEYCPTALGPIADIDGGIEVCFISPSNGDYCNIVFKNTEPNHVSFIPYNGSDLQTESMSNVEIDATSIREIIARFREFLAT